ncbi:MAG: SGNH/GDSL hydrolase family protein [Pirellulaceae bacterium]
MMSNLRMLRSTRIETIVSVLCCFLLGSGITWGQESSAKPKAADATKKPAAAKPAQQNPAYAQIEDEAGLPRVLLLGDSISIGYTVATREALKGKANVHRPATNCSSTRTGLAELDKWLGEKPWNVIHFNFGLHDLKYVMGDKAALVSVDTDGAQRQVPIDEYEANLTKIVERLQQTKAELIWCSTTPVPEGAKGRVPADVELYNTAAIRVMKKFKVRVDDLNAFATPKLGEIQRPRDVHYTPAGSKVLAGQVAESILAALKK